MSIRPEEDALKSVGLTPSKLIECKVWTQSRCKISLVRYQPTDRPIEDRHSITEDDQGKRLILGVYDGHGGSATSAYVSAQLPPLLLSRPPSPATHTTAFQDLDSQMLAAFTRDHSLLRSRPKDWKENAEVVKSGSTALICDINVETLHAVVSNAGDCRLLVCRPLEPLETNVARSMQVAWETTDLNARAPVEQERLTKEHPNEDLLIIQGRLFGKLMSTRGFGDAYYKLPLNKNIFSKSKHKKYIDIFSSIETPRKVPMNQQYESYFYGYKTPPYLTARPDSSVVNLAIGDVIIMASDGLWDLLSSQEVTAIVAQELGEGSGNLALSIMCEAPRKTQPGDDVTIVVLELLPPHF